jgi:hypothetical protein
MITPGTQSDSREAARLRLAAGAALTLSFVYGVAAAGWYVVPWLQDIERTAALVPLLWVHVFRHVALQVLGSATRGFDVPPQVRDRIAYGDVATSVLAFVSLAALTYDLPFAMLLVWAFSVVGILDLVNAMVSGLRVDAFPKAFDITWLILTFYVPILWITHVLILWKLVT